VGRVASSKAKVGRNAFPLAPLLPAAVSSSLPGTLPDTTESSVAAVRHLHFTQRKVI
jgi:hypothetical protein